MSQILRQASSDAQPDANSRVFESGSISVAHIINVLRRYSPIIAVSIAAVIFGYVLIALAYYALSPTTLSSRLPFRLEFEGAERGEYPNGLKFSSSEIVSTPILMRVYEANELSKYVPFDRFKESLFVQESSPELQRLEADYAARLADPKLTPVDRERIEREFDLKKESLRRADFALIMASRTIVRAIPTNIREKVLTDVLSRWAEIADKEKGALRYRLPVLTANIIQRNTVGNAEQIIALDVLRSRVNRVLANIDQLLTIPGAETVRVGDGKVSLEEIRVGLEDVRRFQIEPLIARIYDRGLMNDPRLATAYFETQLGAVQREYQEAQMRVSTLQNSLITYMGRSVALATDTASTSANPQTPRTQTTAEQPVVPQLSDSFLDRVVKLVSDTQDKAYRQTLIDHANIEAFRRLLPAEKEVTYYGDLLKQMHAHNISPSPNRTAELQAIDGARAAAFNEVVRNVQLVTDVYAALSRNLDPDTMLYTKTGPIITVAERSASLFRLIAIGIVLTLAAIPVILIGCLLHARVREDSEQELISSSSAIVQTQA